MIDSKELEKLNKKLARIGRDLIKQADKFPNAVTQELVIGANKIRNTIINSMRSTKRAPWYYTSGKTKVKHHPSLPYNPPAVDTGELIRSIMFDAREMEVEIGTFGGAPYGKWLETGTKDGKLKPRPWLDPAVQEHADDIVKRIGIAGFNLMTEPFEGFD
jgi:hypothetical protein